MLALSNLLVEESLEIRVVPTCTESGIIQQTAKDAVTAFCEKTFAMDGGATLVDTTVEPQVGHKLPWMIETMNISDMSNESSRTDRTDARDGLEEHLRFGFRLSKPSPHLPEIFIDGKTELREHAAELLLGSFLIDLVHMDEVLAPGLELHQCRVLADESFELQDRGGVGEAVAVTGDEYRADCPCILHVGFDMAEGRVDGFGGDVWINDGDVPTVVGEENAEQKMVDASGFEADPCIFLLELPML